MDVCFWRLKDDGSYLCCSNKFFSFKKGAPKDNGFRFCPYCSRSLIDATHLPKPPQPRAGEQGGSHA